MCTSIAAVKAEVESRISVDFLLIWHSFAAWRYAQGVGKQSFVSIQRKHSV